MRRLHILLAVVVVVPSISQEGEGGPLLAHHQGSSDPISEGWNKERPFVGVDTYPVMDDGGTGFDAWVVDDTVHHGPSEGIYAFDLAPEDVQTAMERGWKLSGRIRVPDLPTQALNGSVGFGFAEKGIGWKMNLGMDSDGAAIAVIHDDTITLDGLGNGYHLYELVFRPFGDGADLYVDGALVRTEIPAGRPGHGEAEREVWFGSLSSDHVGQGIYNLVKLEILPQLGDFDEDGFLTITDIDMLTEAVLTGSSDARFDLNNNGMVSRSDRVVWVHELKNTYFGDADLDGEFDSTDLIHVFAVGKYETGEPAGWEDGDWTGDGVFDSSDMVFVFANGGYEEGHKSAVKAVPEPTGSFWLIFVFAGLARKTVNYGNPKRKS
jgi:hypothetical protein